jgi:hypothetical protein
MLKLRHKPAWLKKPAAWLKKLAHAAAVEASTKTGQESPAGMVLPSMFREFVSICSVRLQHPQAGDCCRWQVSCTKAFVNYQAVGNWCLQDALKAVASRSASMAEAQHPGGLAAAPEGWDVWP